MCIWKLGLLLGSILSPIPYSLIYNRNTEFGLQKWITYTSVLHPTEPDIKFPIDKLKSCKNWNTLLSTIFESISTT